MSKLPTMVQTPNSLPTIPTPSVIIFNKVRDCDGEIKETAVVSDKILGVEDCKVMYHGKAYKGVKVYVNGGGYFKSLTTLEAYASGQAHALSTGGVVKLTAKAPLMLGKGK